MCNACGNYCCGSDEFDTCGCDGCPEPECWSEDDEFFGDDEAYASGCACQKPAGFLCVEPRTPEGR